MFRDYNLTTPATKRSWPQKSMRAPRQKPATTESRRGNETGPERERERGGKGGRWPKRKRTKTRRGCRGGTVFIEYKGTSPCKGRERMLDRMRANFLSSSIFGDWKDHFTLLRTFFIRREEIPFSLLIEKNLSIEGILERNVPEKK